MSELSRQNKHLIVLSSVILTPAIDVAICNMDDYFGRAGIKGNVTSGLRDAERQLKVIRDYLTKKGLHTKYKDAMNCKVTDKLPNGNYVWQDAWSNLLSVGLIINPPLQAKLTMDYIKNGVNRKGAVFNQTPHASGLAFNIGGGPNGINDEAIPVKAAADAKMPGLLNYLLERDNNAIHCNCYVIKTPAIVAPDKNVLAIQRALNVKGANPKLAESGVNDAATKAGIAAFQKSNGLVADGIAGPKTLKALGLVVA